MERSTIGFANRTPPLEITWPIAVGIFAATGALLGAALAYAHWKNGRAGMHDADADAAAQMQLQQAPSQQAQRAPGVSASAAPSADDAGEGEARPRGYAQIAPLSDAGRLDSFAGPASNGSGAPNVFVRVPAPPVASFAVSTPLRSSPRSDLDDIELTALEAGDRHHRDDSGPPSPSGHASSHTLHQDDPDDDDLEAMQEL